MRSISAASLDKLAQRLGTEPINVVEIQWVEAGARDSYSDRDIGTGIKGKILSIGGLDNVIQVSGSSESQQVTITVDDTDGSIKNIIDNHDIHKRPCWVYQWFEGLALGEKFLIFKGQISSPIRWSERERTVTFDVISRIEDAEIGFSIEEGDFPGAPEDLIGKPWPLVFGTCINIPALRTKSPFQGTLATGVGIRDYTLEARIQQAEAILCPYEFKGYQVKQFITAQYEVKSIYGPTIDCHMTNCETVKALEEALAEQKLFEPTIITVFGGNRFPQNTTIRLLIDGGIFLGFFTGDVFTIQNRQHPDQAVTGVPQFTPINAETIFKYYNARRLEAIANDCKPLIFPTKVTLDTASTSEEKDPNNPGPSAAAVEVSEKLYADMVTANFFWANPGAEVTIAGDEEVIYIANILPSTILRVAAYREFNGRRELLTVPPDFYTVRQVDYTGYQVMELVFSQPLSRRGQGWSDDIYVTLTSSVGPNTVDILEWMIQTYTAYEIDDTSFNHVRTLIENYPSHFPILERKNLLEALREISYQARCAIWLRDDKFFLRYLPEDPAPVEEIAESDVLAPSLEVYHTPTEDLVTKYVAEWRKDYAIDKPNKIILRHNVKKYGTQEQEENFYIYNIHELVLKSATFWLIRRSNTWRLAKFSTPISKLAIEVFDAVTLDLPSVSDVPIKAIVEQASYNSESKEIDFEVWTPLKSGTKTPYLFAWPADIEETSLFPTIEEQQFGFAGSGQGPSFNTRPPSGHKFSEDNSNLIQGFNLACEGEAVESLVTGACRPDHGNRKPSDRGDQKPEPEATPDNNGAINSGSTPIQQESSSCCQEALSIAKQALAAAKKGEQKSQDADPGQPGELDDLPSCEDSTGNCEWKVTIEYVIPTRVTNNPGDEPFFETEENKVDGLGSLDQFEDTRTETYIFNSESFATEFFFSEFNKVVERNLNKSWQLSVEQSRLVTRHYIPGQDTAGNLSSECEQPADPSIIAYCRE